MILNNQSCFSETREQSLGPFELFLVGWRLIISEIFWTLKSRLWSWEIKQLEKRLIIENIRLAELVQKKVRENARNLDLMNPEIDLTIGQIGLLKEEIDYLGKEMRAKRDFFVENRKQKYLKDQD